MYGYTGKILRVDLTENTIDVEQPDERFYRRYLGGAGFVAYYLLAEVPPGADPLGPDNVLIMAGGAVTGVPAAGAGRSAVGAKSPLNGGFGEADVGGYFGAELRHAGYDALVVRGQAETPVYIWIHDGEAEIRPAEHLWGLTTLDCQEAVRAELGEPRARLAMIGPAGEKLIRYACVINDVKHAAGRTGLGAVMGSKRLKCVVARGTAAVPVADPEGVRAVARWMAQHWREKSLELHELGTNGGLVGLSETGRLPTRNFQDGQFEAAEAIGGEAMRDTILTDTGGCYACPIRCKRVVEVNDDQYHVEPGYGGPEYETVGAFGSNCGVDDLRAIAKANELCNAYGLDAISTGMAVSFAIECFENGALTLDDTGGLALRFGDGAAVVALTQMICERMGIGDILAEGPTRAAQQIGRGAEAYVIDVKKQPFPMHECRTRHGQALGYAVSPTGADHMHNIWDGGLANDPLGEGWRSLGVYESVPETTLNATKVRAYLYTASLRWMENMIGMCAFIPWTRDQLIALMRAITGWEANLWELMRAGERCVTMARAYNLREGLGRADDVLPARMNTPHVSGTLNEKPVDPAHLDEMVSLYYGMMGWDSATGTPTRSRLQELDIDWVAEVA
ncbi:MAG: aldehyde ferredoxin oxidoreductase family protein [Anaerolineae bacterium]|nr:aldehyde ferredoxin oxidoreductase family protein [Anaerolineae bacterium]